MSQVKTALGESSSSLITLCKSNKVNRFSATKPFRYQADTFATYAALLAASKQANYGLEPNECSSAAAALNLAAGNAELWPWNRPPGTASMPCRLGDFRGYNHSAPVPYLSYAEAENGLAGYYDASFRFQISQAAGAEVLASEMLKFQNASWVILYRKLGGSTSVEQVGRLSSITLPAANRVSGISASGVYEACAAIYREGAGVYYPVPNTYKKFAVTVETDIAAYLKLRVEVECRQFETGNDKWKVYMRVRVTNLSSNAISTDYRFILREASYDVSDVFTGSVNSLAAGASTVFYPGVGTENRNFGNGNMTWGVTDVFEGFNNPQFTYSGWVNKNNGGIHVTFSGSAQS